MSAIGASIGYFFTCAATLVTLNRDGDGTPKLKNTCSCRRLLLHSVHDPSAHPDPRSFGVHFGKESYIMLVVWSLIGVVFYRKQKEHFISKS